MLSDEEAARLWSQLFRGQKVTLLTVSEAEVVVSQMPANSRLRSRYLREIEQHRTEAAEKP